jgi:hypothetical protein
MELSKSDESGRAECYDRKTIPLLKFIIFMAKVLAVLSPLLLLLEKNKIPCQKFQKNCPALDNFEYVITTSNPLVYLCKNFVQGFQMFAKSFCFSSSSVDLRNLPKISFQNQRMPTAWKTRPRFWHEVGRAFH